MEISKKQFALYTVALLVIAGSATFALGGKPEEVMPFWERLWKVEQPVTVNGTVMVTTEAGAPIDVTLDEPIEVTDVTEPLYYAEHWEIESGDAISYGDAVNVGNYDEVHIYIETIGAMEVDFEWEHYNVPDPPSGSRSVSIPITTMSSDGSVSFDVKAQWLNYIYRNTNTNDPAELTIIIFAPPN